MKSRSCRQVVLCCLATSIVGALLAGGWAYAQHPGSGKQERTAPNELTLKPQRAGIAASDGLVAAPLAQE